MVDFKLDVNPDALDLGDDEELTLTDDYTNLAVDYTTIKIQKEVNGSLVDTTDADGVSWNRKGNRITYTLQNGVHYVITYSARLTGEPGSDGKVHYDNTAEYFGVKKWTKGDQDIRTGGSGSSPTYGITVFKHEKGAGSSPLSGAKFKLYKYTSTQDQENGWENQPSNAINTETRTPVDSGWEAVKEMTTDSDGVAKTLHSDNIQRWTWYMLIEQEAPVYEGSEHYQLKDFGYVFWITDKGVADYSHYVYLNDDVVAIDNEPPIPETVDVGVTKTWTNDNGDISKRKDITVRLYADGVPYDDWTDKNGDHLAARSDTVKVLPIKDDGTNDGYTWNGLPGGPVYSVVEDGVAGYTTTYSPKNTQVSGTINIKNKYIPGKTFIHVEKNWSGVATENQAEDITVQLKRKVSANAEIRVVSNTGTMREHFPVPVGSVVNIDFAGTVPTEYEYRAAPYTEANNWQGELYIGYKDGTRPAWELYSGNTTAPSALIDSGTADSSVTTEHGHEVHITGVTVGAEGLTLRFPDDYGQGQYDPNLHLSQTPQVTVSGGGSGTYTEDVNFNNENHYYTISAANGWKIDIDRLVKEDDDGKYIYYVEEVGVNDNTETPEEAGYTVTYDNNDGIEGGTGNASQDTIKVTNSPELGSLEVTKTVSGTDAKGTYSIAVKGSNGHYYALDGTDKGTDAFYVSFSKDSTQKWNNLPAGTYTVEEQDASVDGYTWSVTGTGEVEVPVGGNAEAEVTNIYEEAPQTGSLKIEKIVKVDNNTPTTAEQKALVAGTYEFTIASTTLDPAVSKTVSITFGTDGTITGVSGEGAELKDGIVTIADLAADGYTITETTPQNGTTLTGTTVTGAGSVTDKVATVTVTAGDTSAIPTASFTNNAETTSINVSKVWAEGSPSNHPTSVTFKVYRVGTYQDGTEQKAAGEGFYPDEDTTYTITGNAATTVSGLPTKAVETVEGTNQLVTYTYRVVEMPVSGYRASYAIDGVNYTITNTPVTEAEHPTELELTKAWEGGDSSTNHDGDKIEFKLTQNAIKVENVVPATILYTTPTGLSSREDIYVIKGTQLKFTFVKPSNWLLSHPLLWIVNGTSETINAGSSGGTYTRTATINEPTVIEAQLTYSATGDDRWGDTAQTIPMQYCVWTHSMEKVSGTVYSTYADLYDAFKGGTTDTDNSSIVTYTMDKSNAPTTTVSPVPYTVANTGNWTVKFSNLPQMQKVGNDYFIYTYEISEIKIINADESQESVGATENTSYDGESTNYYVTWRKGENGKWTITNTEKEKTEATAVKAWLNADGTNTPPSEASVTFELFADGVTTGKTVTLNGKADVAADPAEAQELIAAAGNTNTAYESAAWTAKWTDLPKYQSDGTTEIKYTIQEVTSSIPSGYEADYGKDDQNQPKTAADNGATITNKQQSTSLKIIKVDADGMTKPLEGAKFEIRKIDPDNVTLSYLDSTATLPTTNGTDHKTGADGEATFTGLSAGYYEVVEAEIPAGYVQTGDGVFYIKVENGTVSLTTRTITEDGEGVKHVSWNVNSGDAKLVFTAAVGEDPATAQVGNDAGTALPQTGGIGTTLFTALGGLMTATAGAILTMKTNRRRKQNA